MEEWEGEDDDDPEECAWIEKCETECLEFFKQGGVKSGDMDDFASAVHNFVNKMLFDGPKTEDGHGEGSRRSYRAITAVWMVMDALFAWSKARTDNAWEAQGFMFGSVCGHQVDGGDFDEDTGEWADRPAREEPERERPFWIDVTRMAFEWEENINQDGRWRHRRKGDREAQWLDGPGPGA